jgi:SulP family sulfate permease
MGVINDEAAILTMFTVIVIATLSFGLVLLLLGISKWGKYTQLIPYPVVGGFLAGVGLLMLSATIHFLSGVTLTMASLPQFLSFCRSGSSVSWSCFTLLLEHGPFRSNRCGRAVLFSHPSQSAAPSMRSSGYP